MTIRKTTLQDLPKVMEIYAYAQAYMKESGNPKQWGDVHPPQKVVEADIEAGTSYVCINDNEIAAVFYFNIEEEPTYKKIDGQWLNQEPYGVIHRIARAPNQKGAGAYAINWCSTQHPNIRIDTHKDNAAMLKLMQNLNFTHCGIIWIEHMDGILDERLAFQKVN
ncbi:MAG: GNAT family N-acetyltransferase [Defluviitaleaceae bacterium]|nr:GNAT family N-acetyltransferase [Defluviitaleaceae bacterium]